MKENKNYYSQSRQDIAVLVPKNIRTILDIGCGQGGFLKLIKEQTGAETWGIEVVIEIAEIAKHHIDKTLIGKVEDSLYSIPDAYFDCITFNDILEHLLEPTEVLKSIRSKLSEDGIIIASIPNVRFFHNLYELLIKKDWKYKDSGILDSTHIRFFTQKSMKRMFENTGYMLIKQEGNNKINTWEFWLFNFLTLGIFNDARYMQFICIAKKF